MGIALDALQLAPSGYDDVRAATFYRDLSDRMRQSPGVRNVAVTDRIPLDLFGNQSTTVSIEQDAGGTSDYPAQYTRVDESYFDVFGIDIVHGRGFGRSEVETGAQVTVSIDRLESAGTNFDVFQPGGALPGLRQKVPVGLHPRHRPPQGRIRSEQSPGSTPDVEHTRVFGKPTRFGQPADELHHAFRT